MKKRNFKKINLQKTIISKFTENTNANEALGGGTSPKCALTEWESCAIDCEVLD
ncbi:MAG: hypothetical protein AAF611_12230 [Bacteroidota bacterium]